MENYPQVFKFASSPVSIPENTITKGDVRLTVLTSSLLRIERSSGAFCDEPTQAVWFRDFCNPSFTVREDGSCVIIETEKAEFCYSLSSHSLKYIKLSDGRRVTNYKKGNLKGTRRTLDRTGGWVKIGDGIISRSGVAVLDDSDSLVLTDDGRILPRAVKESDIYCFAYGNDYRDAVADFFRLCGMPPLVPRFALGNWWSRYKAYTQEEYLTLMRRFIREEIPVTVATVDMDWHWVDVKGKFGKDSGNQKKTHNLTEKGYDIIFNGGWTGYSWNTDLFPDHKAFLRELKDSGYMVTLNVHPATGCRWFEDAYKDFAEFMGIDPNAKGQIPFDITDPKFVEGYFRFLHHPHEENGVDFWWIDWQQGRKSAVEGLDPLWALNHYHSLDSARNGKRPLILSRFAGAGSHRYTVGFSGDTSQKWQALDFQPYFTSTSSNIGYSWWSHDIGGHCMGYKDDELYLRWVQYGIFSPIMRLHSTANEFMGKEPWRFCGSVERVAVEALRLRHRMIPYIYTMNYRTHTEGKALVEPMYYSNPDESDAYNCPNEYWFGSELIAAPITNQTDYLTNLAGVEVWLPEGRYTDIFSGRIYKGGMKLKLYRDFTQIPVLAKEGAIIPLDMNDRTNSTLNPSSLELLIYRGNNEFTLYEDDGETTQYQSGEQALTRFEVSEGADSLCFTIEAVKGDTSILPFSRDYKLSFRDIVASESAEVHINSGEYAPAYADDRDGFLSVIVPDVKPGDRVEVLLNGITVKTNPPQRELLCDLISKTQGKNDPKALRYTKFVLGKAKKPPMPKALSGAVDEILALWRP